MHTYINKSKKRPGTGIQEALGSVPNDIKNKNLMNFHLTPIRMFTIQKERRADGVCW